MCKNDFQCVIKFMEAGIDHKQRVLYYEADRESERDTHHILLT